MTKAQVWILRCSAGFAVWVWTVLIYNMWIDKFHTFGFRAVHITLAVISLGFAAATAFIAQQLARRLKQETNVDA